MILIMLWTVVWGAAAVGLGRLVRAPSPSDLRIAISGFVGLLAMAVVAMWASIFGPVGDLPALAVLGAGLLGFGIEARQFAASNRLFLVALLVAVAALSALGQIPGLFGDQGLYYLQAVEWMKGPDAALGIANLHGRLGFNSSWFAIAALIEIPPLRGRSSFVLSILPIVFAIAALLGAVNLLRKGTWSRDVVYLAAVAVPSCFACRTLGSMSPDGPVWILTFLSAALWSTAFARRAQFEAFATAASLFSVLALTIKPSALPLAAGSAILLSWQRAAVGRRRLLWIAGVSAAAVVPWGLRGLMTSGCLLYPVPQSCVGALPWAVTRADAQLMQDWIASWARRPLLEPSRVLGDWRWLGPWALRSIQEGAFVGALSFLSGGLASLGRSIRSLDASFWAPFALSLGAVGFWFVSAPDPRFAVGALFALALLPVAAAISRHASEGPAGSRFRRRVMRLSFLGCALILAAANPWIVQLRSPGKFSATRWPELPQPAVRARTTVGGGVLNVPVGTDQCWRAPLPCAPDGTPGLSLRGPFALASASSPR
ncbi:MAG TPA: hypothetical protein VIV57_01640 [Anaeromyxobacter sp.]